MAANFKFIDGKSTGKLTGKNTIIENLLKTETLPLVLIEISVEKEEILINLILKTGFLKRKYHLSELTAIELNCNHKSQDFNYSNLCKILVHANQLKYLDYNLSIKTELGFPALYLALKAKQGEKINLDFNYLFEGDVKTKDLKKTGYLVSLIARECYNVCYMKTNTASNQAWFHYFATSLDIMNRQQVAKKGLFMGGFWKATKTETPFEDYVILVPAVKFMSHPRGTKSNFLRD